MTSSIQAAEFRAAGTDLSERRRSGVSQGPLIDITAAPDTIGIDWGADGAARIGALTSIAAIATELYCCIGDYSRNRFKRAHAVIGIHILVVRSISCGG